MTDLPKSESLIANKLESDTGFTAFNNAYSLFFTGAR